MTTPVKESPSAIANRQAFRVSEPRLTCDPALSRTALINSQGTVVAVDSGWIDLAKKVGAPLDGIRPGVNYLELSQQAWSVASQKILHGIHTVLKGQTASFTMDYACQTASGVYCIRTSAVRIQYHDAVVAITHTDITDLHASDKKRVQLERQLLDLQEREARKRVQRAGLLVEAQEQERRRISQDIHDDLGNRIALIVFSIRKTLKESGKNSEATNELKKVLAEVMDLSTAMRDISHSLYPPSLRYAGISGALRTLAEHFEDTHRIKVHTTIPKELPRLSDELQLCIFRIAQECLNNIAKHSGADRARILLQHAGGFVRLVVSDCGRGFVPSAGVVKDGLGLLSMEERASSIGGHLLVSSSPNRGTKVSLTVPIDDNEPIAK